MESTSHTWRAPLGPLVPRPDPALRERRLAVVLFVLTAASVALVQSVAFAVTLLAILAAHEAGHRLVARAHGMRVSWPLFLPAPFFVGTLGALIRLEDPPQGRRALLEMGAAGPLAGLVAIGVAMAVALADGPAGGEVLARPALWWALAWVLRGEAVPLTTGDPVAYAAWVGCLVTAMNLLPFGQLDGGHVFSALAPHRARAAAWATTAALAVLGLAWWGWWAWAVALHALGMRHPVAVVEPGEPPGPAGTSIGVACVGAFVACFAPVPW